MTSSSIGFGRLLLRQHHVLLSGLCLMLLTACSRVHLIDPDNQPSKRHLSEQIAALGHHSLTSHSTLVTGERVDSDSHVVPKLLDCQALQSGHPIILTGNNQIPTSCDLWEKNTHFIIRQDNVVLDCQGVVMSTKDRNLTAITIQTPSNSPIGIKHITLKNCAVANYNHGVLIEQQTPANQRYEQLVAKQTTLEQQRQLSPSQVLLNRILVSNSKNSGIFIGDHVQQVTVANSRVSGSGTVGVYLEFGSGNNQLLYNQFDRNGFRQLNVAGMGIGKPNREAIAVDASTNNLIAYNRFTANGAGGVFLYRNCFEHADDPSRANHFLRTVGSNDNQILDNQFIQEPVGVWVASRQSRNLKGFECGAYLIQKTLLTSYHLDESEQNVISNNRFEQVNKAVILEDDNNVVSFNQFSATVMSPVTVGSLIREQSAEGVITGNQINNNQFGVGLPINQLVKFVGNSERQNLHCNNFDAQQKKLDNVCLVH